MADGNGTAPEAPTSVAPPAGANAPRLTVEEWSNAIRPFFTHDGLTHFELALNRWALVAIQQENAAMKAKLAQLEGATTAPAGARPVPPPKAVDTGQLPGMEGGEG